MNPLKGNSMPDELQTDDVMVQGDSYDEDDYYEEGTSADVAEDSDDDSDRKRKQKNAKFYVLGALFVCVFVVVILICVMSMSNKKGGNLTGLFGGKTEEEVPPATTTITWRGETITVPLDEYGQPVYPEFKYTADEIASLRKVGYTGDEIESFQEQKLEPQPLITQAEMDREAWAQQFVAPYFDTASEEWKSVINTTWYGLTKVESYDTNSLAYQNVSYTLNADYEKVEAYGHQLFIKIYLNAKGDYAFMVTTPSRYAELPATGNMVVVITYTQTGDGQKFITSIVENRVD